MKFKAILILIFCLKAQSAVYGVDDRLEYYEIQDSITADYSKSVAAMFNNDSLLDKGQYYKLIGGSLRSKNFCRSHPFSTQPSIAECSGFLISPNKILTSSLCVKNTRDCSNNSWVFEYRKKTKYQNQFNFKKNEIFKCVKVERASLLSNFKRSYSIIHLDREVKDIAALEIDATTKIVEGSEVYMLGYPHGLPMKFSQDGVITKTYRYSATSTIDTAKTNAGSPIFDKYSNKVIGIYHKGPKDYKMQETCKEPSKALPKHKKDYFIKLKGFELKD